MAVATSTALIIGAGLLAGTAGGLAATGALQPKLPDAPALPDVPTPEEAEAKRKAAEEKTLARRRKGSQTILSGSLGIPSGTTPTQQRSLLGA